MDFTFWSEHLFLYNSASLERLVKDCGFSVVENEPGGHMKIFLEDWISGYIVWYFYEEELDKGNIGWSSA